MTTAAAASKRSTSAKPKHDASTKAQSLSSSQQPRSFKFSEDLLAQKAAAAYRDNPHYAAIEKETLNAVAPFLELAKKRDHATSATSSPSTVSRSYAFGASPSSNVSIDLSANSDTLPKCDLAGASISSDELSPAIRARTGSIAASLISPEVQAKAFRTGSSARSIFSSSNATSESSISTQQGSPSSQLTSRRVSLGNGTDMSTYGAALSPSCTSQSSIAAQQFELMQSRLQALNFSSESLRKPSAATTVPIIAPDPAFLLTKFIHDGIRLYSPSKQEMDEKHRLQSNLESILQVIQPTASLELFGSVKNGLALANADLDLMVVDHSPIEDQLHDLHVDLPGLYAEALRAQGYSVKLLTKTRIPLIKISREYVAGAFSVDISFDNPLALHNTRLMATYNACDPRFRILVMFIKLWARARRINDSFAGTLKSYGYMIMLIYYLQNKASPALLPNLQMISPSGRAVSADELECQGFDIWYAKDVSRMHAIQQNSQSVGELVEGFFSHFAYEFDYRDWVISINVFGGLQTKESKRWTQLVEHMNENGSARVKDRFILCVSDPFEISHNVARTVTRAGLYEIRGSMMAAVRAIRGSKLSDLLTPSI